MQVSYGLRYLSQSKQHILTHSLNQRNLEHQDLVLFLLSTKCAFVEKTFKEARRNDVLQT